MTILPMKIYKKTMNILSMKIYKIINIFIYEKKILNDISKT